MDQILLIMAEKVAKFPALIGGPDHMHSLIPLLEGLCEAEEVAVRDCVMDSVRTILKMLGPSHKTSGQAFFDFFKRISSEESGDAFYARVSSCHMVSDLYRILNDPDRALLREAFIRLCKDELPIVRRAASAQFVQLIPMLDSEALSSEFLQLLQTICGDENQTVQVSGVEAIAPYCALLKKGGSNSTTILTSDLLGMVKSFTDSTSWKIRQALSRRFGVFATAFLPAEVTADIFTCLIHLILDPEPEVRSLAILEVLPYLEVVGSSQFIAELAPAAVQLAEDPMPNVRKLLADLVIDVAAKVGPEAVSMHLSDLIIKLMDDEDPMVRLRIINKIPVIAEEAPSLLTRLTEYLVALYSSTNWRVRKQLSLSMAAVVKHMGQEYFVDHFLNPTLQMMQDGVDEVRTAGAVAVALICEVGNPQWVHETLYPSLKAMTTSEYLVRLSAISGIEGLLKLEKISDKFRSELVDLLVAACEDKVPNIRLRAAQALLATCSVQQLEDFKALTQPCVTKLQEDKDKDVRYFATLIPAE